MLILPAIDLRDGRCVRLSQGDYERETRYEGDPAQVAVAFLEQGAGLVHVVDLDGARSGRPVNLETVARISRATDGAIEVGGGVRTLEDAERILNLGVRRVVMGTSLARDLEFAATVFQRLGDRVVAGVDARDGHVAVEGWTQESGVEAGEFLRRLEGLGAQRFIVTDIATDGMLAGPNVEFLRRMADRVSVPVIASGGIAGVDDVRAVAQLGVEAVIVGKALYEGRLSVGDAVEAAKGPADPRDLA
jgi:phosphoribosylformimino-5-aminoimidazole carboxamide ribotide isomerase